MSIILQVISDTNIGGGGRSLLNYLQWADRTRFQSHVALPRGSALKERIDALRVPVHELDAMADKSMDIRAIAPLRSLIRAIHPDLVHTHGSMAGRISAKLCGKKAIYTKHCAFPPGKLLTSPPGRLTGRMLDAALSDGVIAVGPSAREILTATGIPARKIHVLLNGVTPLEKPTDAQWRAARAAYGFGSGDFVLGILARLEPYKGVDILLDAAVRLRAKGLPVKVLIAGSGSDEARLREQARALPEGTVVFAGFVSEVTRALWAMDLQVNASTHSETSSLSLLEGMSIGLPALASCVGGNPQLIQDGENGFLFPNGDAAALAERAEILWQDPALYRKLSQGAEEVFSRRFTAQIYARNVEAIYAKILL